MIRRLTFGLLSQHEWLLRIELTHSFLDFDSILLWWLLMIHAGNLWNGSDVGQEDEGMDVRGEYRSRFGLSWQRSSLVTSDIDAQATTIMGILLLLSFHVKKSRNLVAKSWCFFFICWCFFGWSLGETKTLLQICFYTLRFWDPQIRTTSSLAIKKKQTTGWVELFAKGIGSRGASGLPQGHRKADFAIFAAHLNFPKWWSSHSASFKTSPKLAVRQFHICTPHCLRSVRGVLTFPKNGVLQHLGKSCSSKWRGPSCSLKLNSSSCPHDFGDVVWPDWLLLLEMKMMRSSW